MFLAIKPLAHLPSVERRGLLLPAAIAALLVEGFILLHFFDPTLEPSGRFASLAVGTGSIFYTLLLFWIILPFAERHRWLYWIIAVSNGFFIILLARFVPFPVTVIASILIVVLITTLAMHAGRWPTYLFISISTGIAFFQLNFSFWFPGGQWLNSLALPVLFILITETVLRLVSALNAQMKRLEILNQVSRRIGSTIEFKQVTSLVSAAIQEALLADTYYVGILKGDQLSLELFYDDGEFFFGIDLPVKNTLGGWVVTHQRSLFLRNVPEEAIKLGLPIKLLGKPKLSQSWMGTPLQAGGQVLGMIAVASYRRNAFKTADLELLESIAQQAALALDNAYHHAEVEAQSRLDSLTQVCNHGFFLQSLNEAICQAAENHCLISLIMLDIDHFKQYNDRYGHLMGDRVLVTVTETIRRHIKQEDISGRWGGEEFVILLRNLTGQQAMTVAERIRGTLNTISLLDRDGNEIPAPTVSLGIAVYPTETKDAESLVHLADQRLYIAKARGRNQIEPEVVV